MTKPVQIINDYWLKEIILNGNPDLNKFYKDDLIKMINILKYENQKYKEVINKAINKLEKGISFCKHDSQGLYDKCNIAILREQEILDILKEVEDK